MADPRNNDMNKMFNDKDFTKRYAEGAEKFTGWFAAELVKVAKLDKGSVGEEVVVLDQACGTGVVSKELADALNDKQKANLDLTCADFADSMIEFVGPRVQNLGLKSAEVVKADANDTKLPSDKFTHVLLNFGPMIFSDGQAGLREHLRLLRPGGTLAMSSWEKVGWAEDVKAAFATDAEIPPFPAYEELRKLMNMGGIWDDPAWIKDAVSKVGFTNVDVREVPHNSTLDNVEEFTRLMAGMVGFIQQRLWTAEQREKYKDRANDAVVSFMKNKYGGEQVKWDWVAILTTAQKAA